MILYFIIMSLILGSIVGSFLLVVALRYNTGKSLQGRSECFSCKKTLSWYELIPIVSYLIQKGRCHSCSSLISLETLGAEILTSLVFGLIAARALFLDKADFIITTPYLLGTVFLFIVFSILIVIFFYDIHHKIIPDRLSFSFGALGFLSLFFFGLQEGVFVHMAWHLPGIWQILGGLLIPLPFVLIWIFSHGRMIGLGDPKLMVGMGFLFGSLQGITSVFVSFWIGTLFIIAMLLVQKVLHKKLFAGAKGGIMKQEVPFGPFLILGTLVTLVFNINLF